MFINTVMAVAICFNIWLLVWRIHSSTKALEFAFVVKPCLHIYWLYVTKSAVSPFALFAQYQSLILLLLLHFSIFLREILKLASRLNLAAILFIGFLNFEFGAILA